MNEALQQNSRQIRVFISSTFLDMQEERDILIKKIFPQLRKLCEERAVIWTEVDLRWGITDEQKAEGKVLPLCLEEIHRCRPYFIGLLGDRYGWVPEPNSIPPDVLESQPWLKQHLQNSVTELEILHGVFREEAMHGHAYFYFRDPTYLKSVPTDKRLDFTSENAEAATKLAKLKQKIRCAREEQVCELRENYAAPEQLGEWILEDCSKLIERLYPKDQTPDPLDQEAARHESYARSRRLAFVGREDLLRRLNEHCGAPGGPLILTGESGCGKSALLAEWVARWRKVHPEDLIIQHYIGSTPDSADWQGLVRRILAELKRAFAITDDIPVQPDALRNTMQEWSVKCAGPRRRVILVLDALNQLADDGAARQLGWLPLVFPTNFRVLVSTLPGESLDALRKRSWPELNAPLFARADIAPAALAYFKIFSKTPPQDIVAKLESTPAAGNALYLRAVLDELRQLGKHEELKTKAEEYLSAPSLPELFDRILTRWHDDFGKDVEHPDLVRRSLCLIASARFGLSEAELLHLLGSNTEPMPRRPWTPFFLAAENALALRSGLLNFGHDYLRAAVQKRWLDSPEIICAFRLQLADYFAKISEPTDRQLDELPTLLRDLEQWVELKDFLADTFTFLRLRSTERWSMELHGFWIPLRQRFEIGEVYRRALPIYEAAAAQAGLLPHLLGQLAKFFFEAGEYASAEPFMRRTLDLVINSCGPTDVKVASPLNNLAALLHATNRLAEAESLWRRALAIDEQHYGKDHPKVTAVLNNLAKLLRETNRHVEAEAFYRRALAICERREMTDDLIRVAVLDELAELLRETNRLEEAESLSRRALTIGEKTFGPQHPRVATILNDLGQLLQDAKRLREAEPLMLRALSIDEKSYGPNHPDVARDLSNLAALFLECNRATDAEPLMQRALAIWRETLGENHPKVATLLSNLAVLLFDNHRMAEAEPLIRQALAIDEQTFGREHPKVAVRLNNLAQLLQDTNRLEQAEPLYRRALEILLKFTADTRQPHPNLRTAVGNYTRLLLQMGISLPDVQSRLSTLSRPYGVQLGVQRRSGG